MRTITNERTTDMLDGLRFLWLEITVKCNLTCVHCYADSGPTAALHGTMKTSDWTKVIDEAADLGCRQLQFIGGEPTLHPELDRMIVHARARGFTFVEIFTNATRLSAGLISCFRENDAHVAASFYRTTPRCMIGSRKGREAGVGLSTVWSPSSGLACHYVSGSSRWKRTTATSGGHVHS